MRGTVSGTVPIITPTVMHLKTSSFQTPLSLFTSLLLLLITPLVFLPRSTWPSLNPFLPTLNLRLKRSSIPITSRLLFRSPPSVTLILLFSALGQTGRFLIAFFARVQFFTPPFATLLTLTKPSPIWPTTSILPFWGLVPPFLTIIPTLFL